MDFAISALVMSFGFFLDGFFAGLTEGSHDSRS